MSWVAKIVDDPMSLGVRLGLFRRLGDGRTEFVTAIDPGLTLEIVPEATTVNQSSLPFLPDELGRPLLDALAAHYGGTGDSRQLRRDYDAERARVDRLIEAVIEGGRR